ncbi:hypothetical protein HDE_02798 [Halotydeus destructor]|nr:hypothetical protein HDE_02798 [Halotydeus destructor]
MKVVILVVIVSLGHCVDRSKYPKERADEMLEGETYIDYKSRKVMSGIYNIPGGHCYHDEYSLINRYCQVNIDSCCFKKHNFIADCYQERALMQGVIHNASIRKDYGGQSGGDRV